MKYCREHMNNCWFIHEHIAKGHQQKFQGTLNIPTVLGNSESNNKGPTNIS